MVHVKNYATVTKFVRIL